MKRRRKNAEVSVVDDVLGNFAGRPFRVIMIVVTMTAILFPIYWLITSSFKIKADYLSNPPILIPVRFTLDSFGEVFAKDGLVRHFMNSLVVSVVSTAVSLVFGSMAAYATARGRLHKTVKAAFGLWFMVQKMYPAIATAIPIYLVMRRLHLIDSLTALIIMNTSFNLPLVIWLMMGFFEQVPIEMEESARIDGCSFLQRFFRVVFPVTKPGLVAAGILAMVGAWNEFLFAVILTINKSKTLPVIIAGFITDKGLSWGPMAATSVITIIPIQVIVWMAQKDFVQGLAMGAVKG